MDMPMVICSLRKKALCEVHTIVTSVKKKKGSIGRYRDIQKNKEVIWSLTLALVELTILVMIRGPQNSGTRPPRRLNFVCFLSMELTLLCFSGASISCKMFAPLVMI